MLQFTRKAISAHIIVKPKYEDTQNVGILFDYRAEKGLNRNLTNIELLTKLTSLLMTICSIRPAKIEGISLRHSVICEQTDKVDLQLQTKTKSGLHSHKLPKTRDRSKELAAVIIQLYQAEDVDARIKEVLGQAMQNYGQMLAQRQQQIGGFDLAKYKFK
ncbi:MAG: hypothetical protein EZS28_006704 [Streblomastix strix]|uniref:Uncharacterized protein n=1 Tax=Streblomastix strix TaxID=222440 RepID=A0A5J4WRM2_9EUKA|nr:MAG: hypothetical protein EZS28_006704 [Streblomastix strix]